MFLYPWGDFHSLNLGWFLLQFKEWTEKIQEYLDNGGGTSENLSNVIAPVFNAENSYLTGDYVLYSDELYKANQAVNPGTWDPDAWTRCLVTEEMGSGSGGVDSVARLMIAGQYSNTYNYQKYAICRYNDKLWMCNTNLPSGGEEWEQSHWDEITVGAGLTGLRRSVETLSNAITTINEALGDETDAREYADSELQNTIDSLGSDDITNESTDVSGATVTEALDNLKGSLNDITPFDTTPTSGSVKGVTSGGVRSAIDNISSLITGTPLRTLNNVVAGARKNNRIVFINVAFQNPADGSVIGNNNVQLFSGFPIPTVNAQGWHLAEVFGFITDAPQDSSRSGKPVRFAINENGVLQTYWGASIQLQESVSISAMYFS